MPSGVSQASALPDGPVLATFSKPISAKLGMRLMVVTWYSPSAGVAILIVVRMLMADDAVNFVPTVILQRGVARQIGDADYPAEPGFGSILPGRNHAVRPIERAGHDLDPWAVDPAEA